MPRGIVNSVQNFSIIPTDKYKDTSDSTKMRWTMAYTHSESNVSIASLKFMMQTLGVQSVPLWMFSVVAPSSSALKDIRAAAAANAPTVETPDTLNKIAGATATSAQSAGASAPPAPPLDEKPKEDEFPKLMALWTQASFIPKPKAIRFIRPAPFTPKAPSTRMDANQGNLTTPTL
jgi:hypothetical protein